MRLQLKTLQIAEPGVAKPTQQVFLDNDFQNNTGGVTPPSLQGEKPIFPKPPQGNRLVGLSRRLPDNLRDIHS
jgi:hypothetical protein